MPLGAGRERGHAVVTLAGDAHNTRPLDAVRRDLLVEELGRYQGNRARVAAALGVSERTVYRWIQRYGLYP